MGSVNLQKANAVIDEVKKVVIGKDACIFKVTFRDRKSVV